MTTYLVTMAMLITNEIDDDHTQVRINLARVRHKNNAHAQLQLDRKQMALNDARLRNRQRIAEIATMN